MCVVKKVDVFLKEGWVGEGVCVGNMDEYADHFRSREEDRKEGGEERRRGERRENLQCVRIYVRRLLLLHESIPR